MGIKSPIFTILSVNTSYLKERDKCAALSWNILQGCGDVTDFTGY